MTIIGNYKVIQQIGEGGFARTYEAEHMLLGTKACLKQNINITPEDADVLKQETALLWDINHHSLPAMKDFLKLDDGSYVLAMTFVEGKNLEQIIKKHKAVHPEDVCWMTQRLLQALYYLHAHGIVHADVKLQNVIVQPKIHNAVLVDYGLSSLRPKSNTRPIGYTQAFAAPELLDGKPPIPQSDLYGLGIVMLYALGGDPFAKTYPSSVPQPIKNYCDAFLKYNPLDRPDWKDDLVSKLSDVRQEVFGRRHSI